MSRRAAVCVLAAALVALAPLAAGDAAATLTVSTAAPLAVVDASFLGVNIDSASLTNDIDLSDAYLTTLAAQLASAAASGGGTKMA